jgi:hypothetical protein
MADDFSDNRFQRRLPSLERKVSEIKPEDIRISVIGTVIDMKDTKIVIDDGSGKIEVVFDDPVKVEMNKMVRVFGRVIPIEEGYELQGEVLQDMSQLDLELKKKFGELN